MKVATYASLAMLAVVILPNDASAACSGRTKVTTGPTGVQKVVCLDGKYSTCMSDSLSMGWSPEQAKSYCDGRKRVGAIK
jgi:hypothetical protein